MSGLPAEIDVVEVTRDQPYGLMEGARGTVVALHTTFCVIEVVDADGRTAGLFDVPAADLKVIEPAADRSASIARED
jgi:hypothetical protein